MPVTVVVGAQWGDEGKGKVVDLFSADASVVARFQGGNNAGHTLVVEGRQRVVHLLPSGILRPDCTCVIGPGVVADPQVLLDEIAAARQDGFLRDPNQLVLSGGVSLIMPYHKQLDALREAALGRAKIGTTGRGIGPAYEDLVGRRAVRLCDLFDLQSLAERLRPVVDEKNAIIRHLGGEAVDVDSLLESLGRYADALAAFVGDGAGRVGQAIAGGENVLLEGAQGTLLDVMHGTYPFVTSSHTVAGAACTGLGIGPGRIDRVLGIAKAYTTRVGAGPFPTELDNEVGEDLRTRGGEFGATTGRPRRCGWLDLVALRYAVRVNGITELALTKLDILTGFESIPVCTAYRGPNGDIIKDLPPNIGSASLEPIYEELSGWKEDLTGCRSRQELPVAVTRYLGMIEQALDVPITVVSVGPDREETIVS